MIVFDLRCAEGHTFEGWFTDGETFEAQRLAGMIACPVCESTQVARIPSPFAIRASSSAPKEERSEENAPGPADPAETITDFVEKHFDNVGCGFAREALKIHYGVAEPRNIRGVSTREEEKTLRQEGVVFFKLPIPLRSPSDS